MKGEKIIISINVIWIGLMLLSMVFFDKQLSFFIDKQLTSLQPYFYNFTLMIDQFATHIFWFLLLSFIVGVIFLVRRKTKKIGFVLLTLVFTHIAASVLTNTMKPEFKRARPEVFLEGDRQARDFYNEQIKDYSFPSSHTTFYLSLFLPAALLFRRCALLLLIIPGTVIIGRVVQNEHYLSDVLCSILIVFDLSLLALGCFYILDRKQQVKRRISKMTTEADDTV